MALVFLGLGTNLGDKERNLTDAILALSLKAGNVLRQSAFYASKSWGFTSDNDFMNAVVLLETNLSPFDLLTKTQELETQLGRTVHKTGVYVDRLIDIDILLYDTVILNQPALKIPHPLLAERDFVMIPLCELAPGLVHPVLGKTIKELKDILLTR